MFKKAILGLGILTMLGVGGCGYVGVEVYHRQRPLNRIIIHPHPHPLALFYSHHHHRSMRDCYVCHHRPIYRIEIRKYEPVKTIRTKDTKESGWKLKKEIRKKSQYEETKKSPRQPTKKTLDKVLIKKR